jgi:biopolymer transport protein TolR
MRQRRAMSEINVVPYIDVMLVLLIIFMVAAPLINPGQIDLPQAAAYDHAIELMAATSQTADGQEGFRAFLDKRPPKFTGR